MTILKKELDENLIIWLSEFNKYILVQTPTDLILERFELGWSKEDIVEEITKDYDLPKKTIEMQIEDIDLALSHFKKEKISNSKEINVDAFKDKKSVLKRYYCISNKYFVFEYEDRELEFIIHPKFAHLEVDGLNKPDALFQLYSANEFYVLAVNKKFVCSWQKEQSNFLGGRVFMQILQEIHNNEENNWMATFHAAGISNGENGIMFLGDSGDGKSTLSAVLMANGYEVLADDFLPFDVLTTKMYYFPAALSIKNGAYKTVSGLFPEISRTNEYEYPSMGKVVKYLSKNSYQTNPPSEVPCRAIVFVKYDPNIELSFEPVTKEDAFKRLVPDSWISPLTENAGVFLDWFANQRCYQLSYSDNSKMLDTIKTLFNEQ